jgi:hypothetical protein
MTPKSITYFSVLFLCIGFLFSSFHLPVDTAAQHIDDVRQSSQSNWTFMVYMSGDSSLSSNVPSDLEEMKRVGSDDLLNIIVLVDRSGAYDTQLLRVIPDNTEEIPITDVNSSWTNEMNLGNPQTLVDFVTWSAEAYPANHYVLDLWGHGRGWWGVCPDKSDYLTSQELAMAMEAISDAGITLDIVSIDACQMGMLETVYELRHGSRYAIVSEKDVPLSGWPYDDVLSIISNNPGIDAESFGRGMINAYLDWGFIYSRYSLTLSLIDLDEINDVVNALDAYSVEASKMLGYFNKEFAMAREETEEYDGESEYDLWHLVEKINEKTNSKRLEQLSNGLFSSLNSCVVYERHWTNNLDESADNAHGLSIWFPNHTPSVGYLGIGLSQDTGWDEFLTEIAPFFASPSRTEVNIDVNAQSGDTDSDGLNDLLEFNCLVPENSPSGLFELEIYGPNGSMVHTYSSESVGWHNLTYPPEAFGRYTAALYLWDTQDELVNYSFVESGLVREGWSSISGRVISNVGRGLKWTQLTLYESDGTVIRSFTTDYAGNYVLKLKVPTDTDGINLTLSCGLGSQRQNVTLGQLYAQNTYNFEIENTHISVLWLTYTAILINIAALIFLVIWFYGSRRGAKNEPDTTEDKMF